MNVRELIHQLQQMEPLMTVWHDGGGDPYMRAEITSVKAERMPEGQMFLGHTSETHPKVWVELS